MTWRSLNKGRKQHCLRPRSKRPKATEKIYNRKWKYYSTESTNCQSFLTRLGWVNNLDKRLQHTLDYISYSVKSANIDSFAFNIIFKVYLRRIVHLVGNLLSSRASFNNIFEQNLQSVEATAMLIIDTAQGTQEQSPEPPTIYVHCYI